MPRRPRTRPMPLRIARAAAVACALASLGCAAQQSPTLLELRDAELWIGRSETPPPDGAAWRPVRLPDFWFLRRRAEGTEGWYRLRVARPADLAVPWSVLLPRVQSNARVYLGGALLGDGGRMEPPLSRNAMRPLAFAIPRDTWRAESEWLHLRFVCSPGQVGSLHPVRMGPTEAILPAFERARFENVVIPQINGLLAIVIGGALLLQSLRMPSTHRTDRWLAGACFAFAVLSLSGAAPDSRLPNRALEWLVGSAIHWMVLLFALWTHRREGSSRDARAWLAAWTLLTLAFALVPPLAAFPLWSVWLGVSGCIYLLAIHRLARAAWRERRLDLAAGAALALFLAAAGSASSFANVTSVAVPLSGSFVAPALVLGFGGYLALRLTQALGTATELARTLDQRVADRERELAANYERLAVLERERALAEERRRLMRDMHDGTGGRLVAALSLLRAGRASAADVEDTIAEALDDLHLTIDSLRPGAADLPTVLGLLRARIDRQTQQHGLRLEWAIGDAGESVELSPEQVLHVIRIVQEAVANAVRHAKAQTLRIATGSDRNGEIWLEIRDDGAGGAVPRPGGRGLANLDQRAGLLGGRLDMRSDASGTALRVWLPPADRATAR